MCVCVCVWVSEQTASIPCTSTITIRFFKRDGVFNEVRPQSLNVTQINSSL
jgi:hypothetical protein